MKILIIHPYFYLPGGVGNNRSFEFAKYFVDSGHKVSIITTSAYFPKDFLRKSFWIKTIEYQSIIVHVLPVAYSHHMHFFRRAISFVQFLLWASIYSLFIKSPDLTYCISTPPTVGLIGILLKKIKKVPFVFEVFDLWPEVPIVLLGIQNRFVKSVLYHFEKIIYNKADLIIGLSEGISQSIIKKGINSSKVKTIVNGTNIDYFRPCFEKNQAKYILNIDKDDFVVLYAGTIGKANGCSFIVKVAKLIQNKGFNKVKFLFVGDGNEKKNVSKLVVDQGLVNCFFVDAVSKNEVIKFFNAANIGIVTFAPYKVLETNSANKWYDYLSCGLPVITNYKGWEAEFMEKYSSGFSTDNTNYELFATIIIDLYLDRIKCQIMGENARKVAEEHFDRKKLAESTLKYFQLISFNHIT
ncbi:MAG: glycosyltransferase family 4 protein [Bacteroidota bacterium]|nr:glycosyltransferase family 4 protein [Bacteroidota bacterium]